ncbi:50S ribosomal protein L18 [Candidatus Bipolaricaulota bacterium]|nr:50S ribosomal protein L18 [Candidatus Bipolaricaulota bacterium]
MGMAKLSRNERRIKRHMRIRRRIRGTPERPRFCVFKSLRHIYAQLIDDTPPEGSRTLVAASTLDPEIRGKIKSDNVEAARLVGALIAQRALARGIKKVVFDRGGYPYHGKVRALAEAAREGGLEF